MRGTLRSTVMVGAVWFCCSGCGRGIPSTDWTCDYDASENRPLTDPDATTAPDGALSGIVCQTTCGTPVTTCTRTVLDGGVAGAICPVCTF